MSPSPRLTHSSKTLYLLCTTLIINPQTERSVASVAPNLRFAVDELELYAQAKAPGRDHLTKALDLLQNAQRRAPHSFDAELFEGITLDILNRHDEAISRFKELRDAPTNYVGLFRTRTLMRSFSITKPSRSCVATHPQVSPPPSH